MKDGNHEIHLAYAEALGAIVHNVMSNLTDFDEIDNLMDMIFTMFFTNLNQQSWNMQAASALCLTKVIQNTPLEPLLHKLPTICQSVLDTFSSNVFKAQT